MQICHHLHGGMGMDITYPMHRYYSTIKDLTRLLGGPSHRLDLLAAGAALHSIELLFRVNQLCQCGGAIFLAYAKQCLL